MAIPVSHSAYPANALLYQGSDKAILYTGDFRAESYLNQEEFQKLREGLDLLTYLEENPDLRIDTLIIEGTNIGSDRTPLLPRDAIEIVRRIASLQRPMIATLHTLDLEYAYAILKIAEDLDLECLLTSPSMIKILEKIQKPKVELKVIEEYVEHPTLLEKTSIEDTEEESLILAPYREVVDLIRDLRSRGSLYDAAVAVLSEPEPEREEHIEYGALANWFARLRIQHYRIRASGHYHPYQLRGIIEAIKPKEIKLIHTLRLSRLHSIAKI